MTSIKISELENTEVQRAFYEYAATKDIISFLMSKKEINKKELNKYINIATEKYMILEIIKEEILNKYSLSGKNSNYIFNFRTHTIDIDGEILL